MPANVMDRPKVHVLEKGEVSSLELRAFREVVVAEHVHAPCTRKRRADELRTAPRAHKDVAVLFCHGNTHRWMEWECWSSMYVGLVSIAITLTARFPRAHLIEA